MSGLWALGAALLYTYLLGLMAQLIVMRREALDIVRRNGALGKRLEESRYMDSTSALREMEAVGRGLDELEAELDRLTVRRAVTLGVCR